MTFFGMSLSTSRFLEEAMNEAMELSEGGSDTPERITFVRSHMDIAYPIARQIEERRVLGPV